MIFSDLFESHSLEEQYSGTPKAIGTAFIGLILKHHKDSMPVLVDFEDGQQAFRLGTPEVKDWFVKTFDSYSKRGKRDQFLEIMGTRIGFQKLVSRYITDKAKAERERLGIGSQKKRTNVSEDAKEDNARTQRMLQQLRLANPLAKTDSEALAYAFIKAQEKDQKAIDRLEKELDDVESDVQGDLKKQIANLRQRREKTQARGQDRSTTDDRQDALLKKLDAANAEQDRALDDLEKEIGAFKQTPTAEPAADTKTTYVQVQQPAKKAAAPRKPRAAKKVAAAPAATDTNEPSNVSDIQAAMDKRDAERAEKAQQALPLGQSAASKDVEITKGTVPNDTVAKQLSQQIGKNTVNVVRGNFKKASDLAGDPKALRTAVGLEESLQPGEYYNAEVTLDDGTKQTVRITSDEGFRNQIAQHFARQGKKVKDIKVDWSIQTFESEKKPKPTNPQLWGRAKSAAKKKFDVYPSAYANAWAAKWYKSHGGGWR